MELKEWETALKLGEKIYNSDIMLTILDTLYKKEGADKFLSIVSNHPKIKDQVIKYLSFNKETASEEIEDYFCQKCVQKVKLQKRDLFSSLPNI